ncbi:hypothetical protein N7470_003738 [Penicillium chermesinum]|nr:hypothetical protein N7470_003738 [Penicillium chermesinum]
MILWNRLNVFPSHKLPDGYVFVPKGDVYITRHCRRKTKESNQVIYSVWDREGAQRIGLRVPAAVHSEVTRLAGLTARKRARAVEARDARFISQSRKLLQTHFPLMPNDTVNVILGHAFLKGSGRVGRTSTCSDRHKVHLAVEAHIRHRLTAYDALLASGTPRWPARRLVLPFVNSIKKAWAGTSEGPTEALPLRPVPAVDT